MSSHPSTSSASTSTPSTWSSQDMISFLSSIQIPTNVSHNQESSSSSSPPSSTTIAHIERALSQQLQSNFSFGTNADLQLYSDLSRVFIQWKIRHQYQNHQSQQSFRTNGVDSIDDDDVIVDDDNDSDLSLGSSHHSSKSISSLPSFPNTVKSSHNTSTRTAATSHDTTRNNSIKKNNDDHDNSNNNEMMDSDLEEDYLSANDSSDIDDDNEDDVIADRVQQLSSMKIDPNYYHHNNENETSPSPTNQSVSNNLLKEFELLMKRKNSLHTDSKADESNSNSNSMNTNSNTSNSNTSDSTTNNDHPMKRGKENKKPKQPSPPSKTTTTTTTTTSTTTTATDHMTSSFRQMNVNQSYNASTTSNNNLSSSMKTPTQSKQKTKIQSSSSSSFKHSPNGTFPDPDEVDMPSSDDDDDDDDNDDAGNDNHATTKNSTNTPTTTTTNPTIYPATPYHEPHQLRYVDMTFNEDDMNIPNDESDSDLFSPGIGATGTANSGTANSGGGNGCSSTPMKNQKETQSSNVDTNEDVDQDIELEDGEIRGQEESSQQQQHQQQKQPSTQSFKLPSSSLSSIFNVAMNGPTNPPTTNSNTNSATSSSSISNNPATGFQFNVDLRRSKSNARRGSPRSRRSRFKKNNKKMHTPTAATTASTTSSGIHFDTNMTSSNTPTFGNAQSTNATTTTTPTSNPFKFDTSPKTMDIDTPNSFPTPPMNTNNSINTNDNSTNNTNTNTNNLAFTIGVGGGTPSNKKSTHPLRRNRSSVKSKSVSSSGISSHHNLRHSSIKSKAPTPEQRMKSSVQNKAQPKFTSSYNDLERETRKVFQQKSFPTQELEAIRNEAKTLYSNEKYHESVLKFTDAIILLTDNFKNMPKPLKKPEESEMLASIYGNRAAALMMVGAYEAAISDCTKGVAHLQGFNPLAMKVENESDVMSYFKPDGGLILMSKLTARKCRAHMKLGNVNEAELAIKETIRISEIAGKCHQKIIFHASQKGLRVPNEMLQSSEKALVHCRSNATLNKSDLHKMKEQIDAINSIGGVVKDTEIRLARRRSRDIISRIEEILKIAPANVEMQESKVLCLASLRKWSELITYCESLAYSISSASGVYVADLRSFDPYPDLISVNYLNLNPGRQLNPKEVAYAVKWMPRQRVAPLYVRALRLEERYLEASKACEALASLTGIDEPVWSPNHKREKKLSLILEKELQKINRTMLMKEEGDKFYREGNYNKAAEMYASVLLVDCDKTNFFAQEPWECETAGGRLHAVLHCNRAACLMALKRFEEAAKECTAALKIHKKYMKAMLRRARCYARIERFEESISEYNRWSGLVQEARANPYAKSDDECMFDRACDVSDVDHQRVMAELTEVKKMKSNKEEKERQAKENARRRASSAFDRRQKWYEQQEAKGPRPWDSFNGSSPKRDSNRYARASSFRTNRSGNQYRSNSSYRQTKKDMERPSPGSSAVTCHYAVLQINPTASQNDIKKAYHKLALKYHPDKNKKESAAEVFRKVKLAYETLSDERQRRLYDVERLRSSSRRY